jgi:endonuclease G
MKVSVSQLLKETNQQPEKEDINKRHFVLNTETAKFNLVGLEANMIMRKEMLKSKGFEPEEFAFERAIGRNDSLYSNFTELIALTKRKVGRIVIRDGQSKLYGTGFLVSQNLLLTNWHVFKTADQAKIAEVQFFYEYNAQGHPQTPVIFKFDTGHFFNDRERDYCFVGVQEKDISGKYTLNDLGYLFLDKTLGKIGNKGEEKLNIIHHPNGDFKQISIRENLFVDIDDKRIYYKTDTARGSSGSPVFNDQWQVVGLHHQSIAQMNADRTEFIDKNGAIIPRKNGEIDESRIVWLSNAGIRISVILNHVLKENPQAEILKGLETPPPDETLTFGVQSMYSVNEQKKTSSMANDQSITINVPVGALSSEKSIDISLSTKSLQTGADTANRVDKGTGSATAELLFEVAKEEKEQAVDFSACRGYDADFLGIDIPLPQPKKSIEKQIARLENGTFELKYFKYSVIFNAIRKMPLISAVNVEGDAYKRLDNSKRKDDWLRDKRIDIECQLTDSFYRSSGFDKGHMGRFEDANWDTTEEKAKRNGIYTCFYTNAAPQVPGINRQGDNLWGKLEKAVLEKGIKKEDGPQARMTVFNGPIFDEEKDRIRKGVTIPMQFYKIVLWLNDHDELKATGFKLSQETLVSDDQFDESLLLGLEAIDIDKLVTYKQYQCSIKSLGRLTKVDFSHIEQYDTYRPDDGGDELLIENEGGIIL